MDKPNRRTTNRPEDHVLKENYRPSQQAIHHPRNLYRTRKCGPINSV